MNAGTKLPLRAAMEAHDRRAVVAAFAPDAVVRSPFTDNLAFEGHDELDGLIAVILEVLEDLTYTDELHADGSAVLVGSACVGGLPIQFCDHLKLRDDGLVEEMTVFFRPLPATTAAMRRIGAGLARRKSAFRGRLVGAMTAPMAMMARTGDRVGIALLRG
ncbi:MAG: nuclear transport factor 2 family protein [Mycobacterium sp.]